jgi:hypothetical protein
VGDLIFLAVLAAFFGLCLLFVRGLERMVGAGDADEGDGVAAEELIAS